MEGKDMNFNLNDMWRRIRCLASLRRMPQGQEVPDRIDRGGPAVTVLFDLARSVVDTWEKGDLAGAVWALDGHLSELDADRESHVETIATA
eukprot:gene22753-43114_t